MGENSIMQGDLFLIDELHRLGRIKFAHIDIQSSCMKGRGRHEEPTNMKERENV